MMRGCSRRYAAFTLFALIGTTSCAGPTGYRAADASANAVFGIYAYGHCVQDLGHGDYAIVVRASWSTAAARAADLALLRAARLTREKGGKRFRVLHAVSLPMERMVSSVVLMPTRHSFVPIPSESTLIKDRLEILVIHVLSARDAAETGAMDARGVEDWLGPALGAE